MLPPPPTLIPSRVHSAPPLCTPWPSRGTGDFPRSTPYHTEEGISRKKTKNSDDSQPQNRAPPGVKFVVPNELFVGLILNNRLATIHCMLPTLVDQSDERKLYIRAILDTPGGGHTTLTPSGTESGSSLTGRIFYSDVFRPFRENKFLHEKTFSSLSTGPRIQQFKAYNIVPSKMSPSLFCRGLLRVLR